MRSFLISLLSDSDPIRSIQSNLPPFMNLPTHAHSTQEFTHTTYQNSL